MAQKLKEKKIVKKKFGGKMLEIFGQSFLEKNNISVKRSVVQKNWSSKKIKTAKKIRSKKFRQNGVGNS